MYVFRSIDCDKRNVRKMVIKDRERSRDNNTFIYRILICKSYNVIFVELKNFIKFLQNYIKFFYKL